MWISVCSSAHTRVRRGNHHFNKALIKLPIYRCKSTQEPSLGRLPPAAGWCQALWNPISFWFSDHYPLLSLSSPLSSWISSSCCRLEREKKGKKERGRWLVIHQHSQLALDQHPPSPAGTCWQSARCSTLQKIDNITRSSFKWKLAGMFSWEQMKSVPSAGDNYISLQHNLICFKDFAW